MIRVRELRKKFGHTVALNGIDFSLASGEFLTIFGPNGAGKSTLLRCLATLATPTSGNVSIDGVDLSGEAIDFIRAKIGMVSHNPFLYENLTAYENLRFYSRMYDIKRPRERIEELLNYVGLYSRRDDTVRTYSRGMLQRLSIARAILHDPVLVFLDEPYTGLDQHAAGMLSGFLRSLHDSKRTVVMITHNLDEGLAMCDKVAVQVKGRFVYFEGAGKVSVKNFSKTYFDLVGDNN